jgi:hypothetical protein
MDERLTDGRRIAELLASEIEGHGDELASLALFDADPDAEATPDGTLAYRVTSVTEGERTDLAAVFVHPDRVRVEFAVAQAAVADAAESAGLRVRPKAVRPPKTLVFVEDGAEVKRTLPVFEAAARESQSD